MKGGAAACYDPRMALPSYQKLMFPMLQSLADGGPRAAGEITEHLATRMGLTAEQRRETFASGSLVFTDRASWARSYMKQAGLLEYPQRGLAPWPHKSAAPDASTGSASRTCGWPAKPSSTD